MFDQDFGEGVNEVSAGAGQAGTAFRPFGGAQGTAEVPDKVRDKGV